MKICPLVTQAYILEDSENEVLVREADDNVMPAEEGEDAKSGKDDIFLNPDDQDKSLEAVEAAERYANGSMESVEPVEEHAKESGEEPRQESGGKAIRVTAKSFRGEVECLGGLCRFHDDEKSVCRFEALLSGASSSGGALEEEAQAPGPLRRVHAQAEQDVLAIDGPVGGRQYIVAHDVRRRGFDRSRPTEPSPVGGPLPGADSPF